MLGDIDEEFRDLAARSSAQRAGGWYWRHALALAVRYGARGPAVRLRSALAAARPGALAGGVLQDVRHCTRGLRKAPGTALAVVATLALGIGAATAVFSVVDATVLEPLPYPDAARLVVAAETRADGSLLSVAWPDLLDWRRRARTLDPISCYRRDTFNLTGAGEPERLVGRMVCWNLLDVLGTTPALGRGFTPEDDRPGAAPVALLGHALWQQRFGGDPSIVGRTLVLDGQPHTIVGVLNASFWFVGRTDLVVPITPELPSGSEDRGNHVGVYAIGRLSPSVTLADARAELSTIAGAIAAEHPETSSGVGASLQTLLDWTVGDVRLTLVALLGSVGFLLLLACANVASLLVARGAARRHEMTVRAMLGGGRWRLARQALVESLTLASAGTAAGLAVAWCLVRAFVHGAPEGVPRIDQVGLDLTTLAFAAGVCALAGLVFGVVPAWQAATEAAAPALIRAPRPGAGTAFRTRRALVAVAIALAVVLLTGAGLMARTVVGLVRVDPGFRPEGVLTGWLELPAKGYPDARRVAFVDDLLARLEALPGVASAGVAGSSLPLLGSTWQSIFLVGGRPVPERADLPSATIVPASRGLVETLGMRLLRGRGFAADREPAPVAMVNARLAREMWPDEDPIGKVLRPGWPETPETISPWREVIGVVADVAYDGPPADPPLQIYLPYADVPDASLGIVVRATGDPLAMVPAVRRTLAALDPSLPFFSVRSMDEIRRASTARERLLANLLTLFAAVALLLASVGLAGVVGQGVTERRREIGLRMALGASGGHVRWLVMSRVLAAVAAGAIAGLAAALALSRWLAGLLFGVSPFDPATLAGVVVVLALVTFVAAAVPARRATTADPLSALRVD